MEYPKIPSVMPIADGKFVTVPSASWNEMCNTVNNIITTLNNVIEHLDNVSKQVDTCDGNISKIATILEDIYEKTE